ncbi:hypothetical protein [Sphingobium sp. YG1]|uniref:hypothetical protein n=1 Tax=Sphingobium sp. YG1 TaxID=2082188 RepID=UPI001E32FAC2|nr:hypothetical protein [Sphingobium sp. YG1]
MTNRTNCPGLSEMPVRDFLKSLSATYRNRCPGLSETRNVRAKQVDAEVERLLIEALQPDRIDLALAAQDQMNGENRLLERQWALKREKAHYEAERARRQYDAVEPENRLVARSLETLWEEKIREADASNRITRGGMSSRLTPWPPPRERVS